MEYIATRRAVERVRAKSLMTGKSSGRAVGELKPEQDGSGRTEHERDSDQKYPIFLNASEMSDPDVSDAVRRAFRRFQTLQMIPTFRALGNVRTYIVLPRIPTSPLPW